MKTEVSVKAMHDKEVRTKEAQLNALQASTIKLKHQFDAQTRLLNGTAQNKSKLSNAPEEKQRKVQSTVIALSHTLAICDVLHVTCACACA